MKSVLLSIKPKYCQLIANGKKTFEVRKTKPKLDTPFKCYIYCTKGELLTRSHYNSKIYVASSPKYQKALERNGNITLSGKVIGEFVCDEITGGFWIAPFSDYLQRQSCLSYDEVCDYAKGKPLFAWHISNLIIYDKPRELSEFHKPCTDIKNCLNKAFREAGHSLNKCFDCGCEITKPSQSWCYVESEDSE